MLSKDKPDEALRILWDEYRYRHELCWRVPVQLTTAAVALSTLPYLNCRVVQVLGEQILLVPYVGVALTLFGALSMGAELALLTRVRTRYRAIQEHELGFEKAKPKTESVALFDRVRRWFNSNVRPWLNFAFRVEVYLAILLVLQLINISVLRERWIPTVRREGCAVPAPPLSQPQK